MLNLFGRNNQAVGSRFDVAHFHERLAEILVEAGLDEDQPGYVALHKMISDDVAWYLENLEEVEVVRQDDHA